MHINRRTVCLFMAVTFLCFLCACNNEQKETTEITHQRDENQNDYFGTWSKDNYTNEWLGVGFKLPDKLKRTSVSEMEEMFAQRGVFIKESSKTGFEESHTYYDFTLQDSENVKCVTLCFVDTMKAMSADISASNYCDTIISAFKEQELSVSERSIARIAENDYISFEVTFNDNVMVDYYINKHDDIMVVWIISRYSGQSPDIDEFISTITKL